MAVGSNFDVILDEKLNDKECAKIHKSISSMQGVMSSYFNEKSKKIQVCHTGVELTHERPIAERIKEIPGVKAVMPIFCA